MGNRLSAAMNDQRQAATDAISEILKCYHIKPREVPDSITDMNETLEYLLRPHGIMRRNVSLEKGWEKGWFDSIAASGARAFRPGDSRLPEPMRIACLDSLGYSLGNLLTCLNNNLTGLRIDNIVNRYTTQDTL